MTNNKSNPNFDDAIAAVRREQLDTATLNAAGARVWNKMHEQMAETVAAVEKIRGCEDVQALLPAYHAGALPQARALIVRDHLSDCTACRHKARHEAMPSTDWQQAAPVSSWGLRQFALAAMILFVVGLSTYFGYNTFFAPIPGSRATVQSVEGSLYAMNTSGERQLAVGDEIAETDVLRTSGGSHAFVRLLDGSVVEMNERSEFSVSARRSNTTVNLLRGKVIVQAAKRKSGHLYVSTPDALVSVTGTVFSVNSGMKGSRVSVIEGEVEVEFEGNETVLHSGDQVTTSDALGTIAVADEISWSQNLEQHLALLAEFAKLRQKLESVPLPGLGYKSNIVTLMPAGTIVYGRVPNYGEALAEANKIFQQQLQQSEVLRQWWARQSGNNERFQEMVERVRQISQYLGDEIVFTMVPRTADREPEILVVAELRRAGLKEFVEAEAAKTNDSDLKVLDSQTLGSAVEQKGTAYLLVREDFMIFSTNLRTLHHMNGLAQAGGEGFTGSGFGQRVAAVYERGAGFFLAVNMDSIAAMATAHGGAEATTIADATGFRDAKFFLVERRDVGGQSDTRAVLEFKGARRGVASWLAAPAPMGSLEFVSPNASGVFAVVAKSPALMLDDMTRIFSARTSGTSSEAQEMNTVESKLGISLREDLAATFGGDIALALDGPVLPTPSWKLVAEVYDPSRLQSTIERLVAEANREAAAHNSPGLQLNAEVADGGRTFYEVKSLSTQVPFAVHYTFSDGYLIMAPSRALIVKAITTRQSGVSLARSQSFRALLPNDTHTNCSGVAYQNLGPVLQPLIEYAPQQSAQIKELAGDMKPTVVCAYGDADRIQLASASRLFGLDFNMLGLGALVENREHRQQSSRNTQ